MPTREMVMLDDLGLVTGPTAFAEFTTLNAVVAAVGADPLTVIVNRTLTADTVTVPVNLVLMFMGDGEISVNAVQTITGNGYIWAPAQTIFVGAGTFNLNTYPQNAAWWGLADDFTVGDGAGGAITIDVMETALLAADAAIIVAYQADDAVQDALIAANIVSIDYLDLQVDGYVGVDPQVGGVSPFQTLITNEHVESISPIGAITVRLPTGATVPAGYMKVIENRSTNEVTIESSSGAAIDIINTGFIVCRALQANPTLAAHWDVVNVYERVRQAVTFTFAGGAAGASNVGFIRHNGRVSISINQFTSAAANNTGIIESAAGEVLARLRPLNTHRASCSTLDNATDNTTMGIILVEPDGTIAIWEDSSGGGFAGGGASGSRDANSIIYDMEN